MRARKFHWQMLRDISQSMPPIPVFRFRRSLFHRCGLFSQRASLCNKVVATFLIVKAEAAIQQDETEFTVRFVDEPFSCWIFGQDALQEALHLRDGSARCFLSLVQQQIKISRGHRRRLYAGCKRATPPLMATGAATADS